MLRNVELRIPPTYLNVLNFLIFDVILISLVYLLSADVMGRLNDVTLCDGKPHRLFITCPPVLGGGLCTTNRLRAQLLLFSRLLGLGLILASGLAVKGEARAEIFFASRNVLTHGNVSHIKDTEAFVGKTILRSSCQGTRVEGNRTLVFFGELREVQKKRGSTLECVIDRDLLSGLNIEYDALVSALNLTVTTGQGCRARSRFRFHMGEYFCPHATLTCLLTRVRLHRLLRAAGGVLRHKGEMYMIEEGASFPEILPAELTELRRVRGIDLNDTFWMDSIFYSTDIMLNAIGAASIAKMEKRVVKDKRSVEWTMVNPLWFFALALKLLLVLFLGISSCVLKRSGFHTVVHDEAGLSVLLNSAIEEQSWPERRKLGVEEGSIFINAHQSADGPLFTANIQPRSQIAGLQTGNSSRRRNSDIHRLEAMYM